VALIDLVIIEPVVIIHVLMGDSRARRGGGGVRPPANVNIQGGMTFRLVGPHSRPKERHEEKKGKERRERARRPEVEREEPQLVHSTRW